MAHQTRISGQFAGENQRTYTWIIYSEVGAQVENVENVCLIDDSFILTYESGTYQEVYKPIVSSNVSLTLLATSNDMLSSIREMVTNDESKTYIEIYDDAGWKWVGHILPEATSILITDGMTEVTMQFADGLQLLKSFEFLDDTTATYFTGSGTALKWIYEILTKIPWVNEQSTSIPFVRDTPVFQNLQDVYDPDDDGASGLGHENYVGAQPIISDWSCPAASFRVRPEDKTPDRELVGFRLPEAMSCHEVLEDILISLGCRICWNGYEWHVFSPLNYTDEAQGQVSHDSWVWSIDDLTTNGTAVAGTYDVFNPYINFDVYYALRSGATLTYGIPARKTVITHAKSGQYIVNPESSSYNWSQSTDVAASSFSGNDEDGDYFEYLDGLALGGGEDLNYSFKAAAALPPNLTYVAHHPCFVMEVIATAANGTVYRANKPLNLIGSYNIVDSSGNLTSTVAKVSEYSETTWQTSTDFESDGDDNKMYFPLWIHDSQANYNSSVDDLEDSVLVNNLGVQYTTPAMTITTNTTDLLMQTAVRSGAIIDVDGILQFPDTAIDEVQIRWGFALFDEDGNEVDNSLNRPSTDQNTVTRGDHVADRWFDDLRQHSLENFKVYINNEDNDVDIFSVTQEGSFDVIDLGSTVVGTGYSTTYNGPGYWRTNTGPSVAGNTFGTVTSYFEDWTLQAGNTDNLRLLSEYWMRFLLANAEGVSFQTASRSQGPHGLLTPDLLWNTGCVTGIQSQILPSRIIWRNTSSYNFEGIIIDYDATTQVELESDNSGKGRVDTVFNDNEGGFDGKPGINPYIETKISAPGTKATNDVLAWNGSSYVSRTPSGVASSVFLTDLKDVSLTRTAANNGKVLSYDSNADGFTWVDGGGGDDTIDVGYTTTDAVGAVPAGTVVTVGDNLEDLVRSMLLSYQAPVMSVSSWSSSSNREHGYPFSDTQFTLGFTNPSNVDVSDTGTAAFSDSILTNGSSTTITAAGNATQTVNFSRSGDLLVTSTSPAGASGGSKYRSSAAKLTVSGFSDTNGGSIASKTSSSTVKFRYFVLANTTRINHGSLNDTNGMALIDDVMNVNGSSGVGKIESGLLTGVSAMTISASNPTGYVYYIYPACFDVSLIKNPSGSTLYAGDETGASGNAITYIGQFDMTNQYGKEVTMKVLRSTNSNAFSTGTYTVS